MKAVRVRALTEAGAEIESLMTIRTIFDDFDAFDGFGGFTPLTRFNRHVVRLYEVYETPDNVYMVLENCPCGDLEKMLYMRGWVAFTSILL